jgi:Cu2+-exporting ATPase
MKQARVNFSTQRLVLAWQGTRERAEEFVRVVEGLGYRVRPFDARGVADDVKSEERRLLLATCVAGFASGNIMLLSFALWSTTGAEMGEATRALMHWVSALIAIPTAVYSGRPFFSSALAVLKKGRTNMDVPISVGVVLTTLMSLFETLRHAEHTYFDSVVMLLFFLLVGRYFDFRARQNARGAAGDLLAMMAGTATVREEGGTRRVLPIRELREGMVVLVAMGERIPADAVVLEGESSLDTSLVTGESLPRPVKAGEGIYSGMLNLSAPLVVRVAKAAEDSLLADIVRLMEKAEQGQAKYVRLAEKVARLYTPVVHLLALVTFLWWVFVAGLAWQESLMIAVTVLIITCPCALGLAVPVVQVLATSLLMKRGILVKTGDAFERLAAIDTLLLDKTGTLTLGRPSLENISLATREAGEEGKGEGGGAEAKTFQGGNHPHPDPLPLAGEGVERWHQLAASLASRSHHPLSKALAEAWTGEVMPLSVPLSVSEHPGQGLEAQHDGHVYRLGSRSWCNAPSSGDAVQLELWLAEDGKPLARFAFADPLRVDAKDVLARLRELGLRLVLLSGDRKEAVDHAAAQLGLTEAEGEMKPTDKFARLEKLKAEGRRVGMVGDGLNDAPVLAGADVSLSPATAIDMAQNAADIVFMGEKLEPVLTAVKTARFSQVLVRQNLFLAILYNVVAVPLAMLGHVTPLVAAIAMSSSSLVVIGNAFRLRGRVNK